VGTYETAALSPIELITKMIGRTLTDLEDMTKLKVESGRHISKSDALLEAKGLGRTGSIKPFDLNLHAGEVVGLAGLLGSGRTEMAQLLFGLDQPNSGSITMDGKLVRNYSPINSIERGVAFCPEDRKAEGIVPDLTVRENIILAMQAHLGWFKYLSLKKQYEIADKYIKLLNISTPSADQPVKNLSGGNQQKVILARWLATNPRLLILDEPTKGIDVAQRPKFKISAFARRGRQILCIYFI